MRDPRAALNPCVCLPARLLHMPAHSQPLARAIHPTQSNPMQALHVNDCACLDGSMRRVQLGAGVNESGHDTRLGRAKPCSAPLGHLQCTHALYVQPARCSYRVTAISLAVWICPDKSIARPPAYHPPAAAPAARPSPHNQLNHQGMAWHGTKLNPLRRPASPRYGLVRP